MPLLSDAAEARAKIAILQKRAFSPGAPTKPLRQTMTDVVNKATQFGASVRSGVGSGAGRLARTLGGGLAVVQAVDSVPNVVAKGSRDYSNILGAYYEGGGR